MRRLTILVVLLALLAATALVAAPAKEEASEELYDLTFITPRGTIEVMDDYNLWVAIDMGYFAELGLNVIMEGGPTDAFAYKVELKHENWRNILHLLASRVDFGLMTDHPVVPSRNLLLQTRWFLRAGWTRREAIELVSRRNAEILGVGDRLGALKRGRWASFVCWNNDPFDLSGYPTAVFGEGKLLYESNSSQPGQRSG